MNPRIVLMGLVFVVVFGIPIYINYRVRKQTVHVGGLFNIFDRLGISRVNYGWLFLGGVYHFPLIALLIGHLIGSGFEIDQVGPLITTMSITSLVLTICANMQATFIERDAETDVVIYWGVVLYYLVYIIPAWVYTQFLPPVAVTDPGIYYTMIIGSIVMFVTTIIGLGIFLSQPISD